MEIGLPIIHLDENYSMCVATAENLITLVQWKIYYIICPNIKNHIYLKLNLIVKRKHCFIL